MKNKYDPGHQIEWLEAELSRIESIQGQVIIIAHYPATKLCTHTFGHRYRGLLDRYQNIIRMSLYGHTHQEDIQVVQSITDNKNIGFNYIGGSMTTIGWKNPSFNVIEFDAEYMIPINIKSYSFDLATANLPGGSPTWGLLHDYTTFYSLPDMRPDNLFVMASNILNVEANAIAYLWNKNR